MKSKYLAGILCALSLTGLAGSAQAADCSKNYTFKNTQGAKVQFVIESRTRANPRWYNGNYETAKGWAKHGRFGELQAGETLKGIVTYPVIGCNTKRKIRIKLECWKNNNREFDGQRIIDVSRGEWHRPYHLKSDLKC
ncbi:MAG: hypothetical protein RIC18_06500 [Hoeflea sp.]|uniref:hypothetical protein n=1 Tax=Hoeflea sp. TaxID=1940281 RepID=UPI0032EB8B1C